MINVLLYYMLPNTGSTRYIPIINLINHKHQFAYTLLSLELVWLMLLFAFYPHVCKILAYLTKTKTRMYDKSNESNADVSSKSNLKYSRILEYPTLLCDKTRTFPLLNSHIKYVYKIPCNMVYVYAADLNGACKYIYILNKTSYTHYITF